MDLRIVGNPLDSRVSDEELKAAKTRIETTKTYRTHRAVNYLKTGTSLLEGAAAALYKRAVDDGLVQELEECRKLSAALPTDAVDKVWCASQGSAHFEYGLQGA